MKHVIALIGSTRLSSTNHNLVKAITELAKPYFTVSVFETLAELPHFNPDNDFDHPPAAVTAYRKELNAADGILICTPEYAMGVPGTLKNAIDWTVSSCEFSHKPTALITASTLGEKGHASLLGTLQIIEAGITDETQLLIPQAGTKVSRDAVITDPHTEARVTELIVALNALLNNHA